MIDVSLEIGKEKTLQAILTIRNASNIEVYASIYGPSVNIFDLYSLHRVDFSKVPLMKSKPKTFTVIYGHNATQTRNRKIILGQRQMGDKMIAFQKKNVTFSYRFAETEFQYQDDTKHITSVGFSFDVGFFSSLSQLMKFLRNPETKKRLIKEL